MAELWPGNNTGPVVTARIDQLVDQASGCLEPLERATTLPAVLFSDPGWYEAERTTLLHRGWIAVARSSELGEPNRYVTATIGDEPVVVVRGRDGQLRALSNVCRHRNTVILTGAGRAPSLQCPYHRWTYRHDGSLASAPEMERSEAFDAAELCLPTLGVEEWHGWVLDNVDGAAPSLAASAPALDELMSENRVGEVVPIGSLDYPSPWNWKISVENFLESYHHRSVHPRTLEPGTPGAKSFARYVGAEPWSAIDHVSVIDDEEPFIAIVFYPTLMFAILRGIGMVWFRLEPLTATSSHLTIECYQLPEVPDDPETVRRRLAGNAAVNDEDVPINEMTAAGLRSRFATPGPISHLEAATWHFRQWLLTTVANR